MDGVDGAEGPDHRPAPGLSWGVLHLTDDTGSGSGTQFSERAGTRRLLTVRTALTRATVQTMLLYAFQPVPISRRGPNGASALPVAK